MRFDAFFDAIIRTAAEERRFRFIIRLFLCLMIRGWLIVLRL